MVENRENNMRILIAVPTFETIMPETFKSIYGLRTTKHLPSFNFVKGYDCARARNMIAQEAIDEGHDYVLFVDSDMVIPDNTLEALLDPEVDICFGLYPQKNTRQGNIELFKLGTGDFVNRYTYGEVASAERLQVKGAGFGCALIRTEVFKKLPFPWFKFITYDNGSILSEDLYFCNEAGKHGFELWADTRVRCGHAARYFQYE